MFKDLISSLKEISSGMTRHRHSATDSKQPSNAQWRTTEKGDHILIKNGKVVSSGVVSDWIRQKQSNIQDAGGHSTNNQRKKNDQSVGFTSSLPSVEKSNEILGKTFKSIALDESQIPSAIRHEYVGTTPSKEDAELSMRKTAAIVSDIVSRFPNNGFGLDKCVFYPALFNNAPIGTVAAYRPNKRGLCVFANPARMTDTLQRSIESKYRHYKHNPGILKSNVQFYYPVEWFGFVSLLHEFAHSYFDSHAPNDIFADVLADCLVDYNWSPSKNLSSYSGRNIDEAHSECVAMIACPLYKVGTLPEPMERYVCETVLGCYADSLINFDNSKGDNV